ncbi:unnamed protein product [Anisakis simplex]|uniref:Uncharacterized protein n=1 Tax=Anisakis simplex TaxID=6269 RepID=A0A0M3JCU8_ANISI|nr:unnamed protein product [Anisakis simplex]
MSSMSAFAKHAAIVGTNTQASFHVYPQKRPIAFSREDMKMMTQVRRDATSCHTMKMKAEV